MRPTDNLEGLKDIQKILRDPQKIVQALGDQSQPTRQRVVPRTPHVSRNRRMPPHPSSNIDKSELTKALIGALVVKNPNTLKNLAVKTEQMENAFENTINKEMGKVLAQGRNMPVINKFDGGDVLDFFTDVGKDLAGDLVGGVVGAGLQSLTGGGSGISDTVGAFFDSPVGRGVVRGGVEYGIPYLEEKLFGTDYYSPGGPSLEAA